MLITLRNLILGLVLLISLVHCQTLAYVGLQPAQIPEKELAGIDLFLDNLVQFAMWCIMIAMGLPPLKLDLWKNLLSQVV